MLSCLDFEKNKQMLHKHGRPEINKLEDLKDELKAEWNNMILFASDEVLTKMHKFLENPSQNIFRETAIAMRKDLWGGNISSKNLEKLTL